MERKEKGEETEQERRGGDMGQGWHEADMERLWRGGLALVFNHHRVDIVQSKLFLGLWIAEGPCLTRHQEQLLASSPETNCIHFLERGTDWSKLFALFLFFPCFHCLIPVLTVHGAAAVCQSDSEGRAAYTQSNQFYSCLSLKVFALQYIKKTFCWLGSSVSSDTHW